MFRIIESDLKGGDLSDDGDEEYLSQRRQFYTGGLVRRL